MHGPHERTSEAPAPLLRAYSDPGILHLNALPVRSLLNASWDAPPSWFNTITSKMSDHCGKSAHDSLPSYASVAERRARKPRPVALRTSFISLLGLVALVYYLGALTTFGANEHHVYQPTAHPHVQSVFAAALAKCDAVAAPVGAPAQFHQRTRSERAEPAQQDVLIRNATVWTGLNGGNEVLEARDILLSNGIIKRISKTANNEFASASAKVIDAAGRWVTPGLVDMHVHLSVGALPALPGHDDVNSIGKNTNPYLRTIDGMNQHDVSFRKSLAGGITTGLVLPGSANSMGGQAFPIKYRQPSSHLPQDRLIEPPTSLAPLGQGKANSAASFDAETGLARNDSSSSWRYMKMACGENARRVYKMTRFDEAWDFRRTFAAARELKNKQDAFCDSAGPSRRSTEPVLRPRRWPTPSSQTTSSSRRSSHCCAARSSSTRTATPRSTLRRLCATRTSSSSPSRRSTTLTNRTSCRTCSSRRTATSPPPSPSSPPTPTTSSRRTLARPSPAPSWQRTM